MGRQIGRGMLLALAAAVIMVMKGRIDLMAAYGNTSAFFTAMAVMMIPGAFLMSLPRRIRHRREPRKKSTWKGCAACFAGGLALALGAGLAEGGDGLMLTGVLQGSVSAYVFLLVSWISGLAAYWLVRRKKA
ncbi:MAG: hypothetical protein IJ507_09330 [Clostridia bacterium]|nr:hypothetical protein [Clostridia bacterium]